MADVPRPGPTDEAPGLSLFDEDPAAPRRGEPLPKPSTGETPPPGGGLRETILRFLEEEL